MAPGDFPILAGLGAWADKSTSFVVSVLFVALVVWESVSPARATDSDATQRWFTNISLYAVGNLLIGLVIPVWLFGELSTRLSPLLPPAVHIANHAGAWPALIAGILILDFYAYAQHRIEHRVFLLWRVHSVHHSDVHLDASTALRHHPIDYFATAVVGTLFFAFLGIPEWMLAIYALSAISISLVQHSNIVLSDAAERTLSLVVFTPRLHQIHHSVLARDYDSNFGSIFTFWDRLFGTFRDAPVIPHKDLVFGVLPYTAKQSAQFSWAWIMPFVLRGSGSPPVPRMSETD